MTQEKKERIFISYKRVDKNRVFAIKDGIEQATGEKCWIDLDGIESDAQFAGVIISAINRCEVFLFMYSKEHAKISDLEEDWTIKEITFAKEKKKRIVIINIDDTPLIDQFLFEFPRKQRIDASDASALARLYKDLCTWLKIDIRKIQQDSSYNASTAEQYRLGKEKELQERMAKAEAEKKALEEKMRLAEEKVRQAEEKANQIEKRRLAERQAREYLQKNKVEKPQELPKIETNLSVNDLCKNADNYYYGRNGVKKDYIEAFKYYQKAADKGSSHAQVRIAECYNMGRGVRLDKKEAFKWYRMAAEQGNMHAQFILGEAYETGEYGVPENFELALKWYQQAADQGNVNAKQKVAKLSYVFVKGWLKKADDYFYGRNGFKQDYTEAATYYQKAAELGDAYAQFSLGYCYYFGKGVKQNYSEAARWFREAALKADNDAQYFLGNCYYFGRGVAVDYSEAFKWYLKSAEAGDKRAQHNLGACYYYGKGVARDLQESTKWFLRSANKGYIEAQFTVGLAYEHGYGVEINISEANKWYRKAAEQGHEKAIKKINELGSINESKHRVKGYDNSKTFDVILKSAGVNKLQVVKTIKEQTGYGLKESKDIVDAAPSFIKRGVDRFIAERIKKELEEIGAIVELYENSKTFDVILKSAGVSKLQVVKTIKEQTGLGLKESKDIVDAAPSYITRNVDKVMAETIKKELEKVGASVEIR